MNAFLSQLNLFRQRLRNMTRALRYRNFRLFISGQCISLVGTWMQRIALGWLVYRLSGSAFLLGVVGFAGQLPVFLLAPFAGVLADRMNRHRLVIVTQIIAMLQALALAVLVLSGSIRMWQVMVLSVILGIVNAVDMPGRQSFMHEMIDNKADLSNAIALNSSVVNVARLLGPSVAGLLIALTGEGICFLINGLSYLAVLAALLAMKLPAKPREKPRRHPLLQLKDGIVYAYSFQPIRAILTLLAIISLMGMSYTVLMPVFAKSVLRGGPETLGLLMGAAGIGALVAAVYLASRTTVRGLARQMVYTGVMMSAGLLLLAASRHLLPALVGMILVGFGMVFQMAGSNTMLQTLVDDDKRGRVMSLYTFSIMGMAPFGSLLFGALAHRFGVPATLAAGGAVCLAGTALFYSRLPEMRRHIRPIYVRLGIIPEIADGLRSATEATVDEKNLD